MANVHLGHILDEEEELVEVEVEVELAVAAVEAVMAALRRVVKGGLMPQARHGGMVVDAASAGSKLDGTGFANEQIGHTHVAVLASLLILVDAVAEPGPVGAVELDPGAARLRGSRLSLGDERRNRAWQLESKLATYPSTRLPSAGRG